MCRWDVMTYADLCVDLVMRAADVAPEFGQKEKILDSYTAIMGGSCSIFACQCAKLGLKTAVVGRLGKDVFSPIVLDELTSAGVDTQFVVLDSNTATGLTCILQAPSDRAMLTVLGSIVAVQAADAPEELMANVRHLHIGSYYLMKQMQSLYPQLLPGLRSRGVTVSLDTNWDPEERWDGLDELVGLVDIFLPNENEVKAITGLDDPWEGAAALAAKFPVVAVKLGQKGALACAGGQRFAADALSVSFVDAVGAGDSFDGGFVFGWLNNMPIQDCLRLGCFCGSMNVTKQGGTAGQPTAETLHDAFGFTDKT